MDFNLRQEQVDLTIEDLLNNPKSYGLPTFEEFARNPEAWRKSAESVFNLVDVGSTLGLKNLVVKQTYEVAGFKCDTLEEVERICLNEGFDRKTLEIKPEVVPIGGGKCEIHVRFTPGKRHQEQLVEQAVKNIIKP